MSDTSFVSVRSPFGSRWEAGSCTVNKLKYLVIQTGGMGTGPSVTGVLTSPPTASQGTEGKSHHLWYFCAAHKGQKGYKPASLGNKE